MLQLVSYLTLPNLSPLPKRKCRQHLNANMLRISGISASSIAALCEARGPETLSHCALKYAVFLVGRTAILNESFSKHLANCIGAYREMTLVVCCHISRTLSGCHFVRLLVKELLHLTLPLEQRCLGTLNTQPDVCSRNACCVQLKTAVDQITSYRQRLK